jgi:hypothetical protein
MRRKRGTMPTNADVDRTGARPRAVTARTGSFYGASRDPCNGAERGPRPQGRVDAARAQRRLGLRDDRHGGQRRAPKPPAPRPGTAVPLRDRRTARPAPRNDRASGIPKPRWGKMPRPQRCPAWAETASTAMWKKNLAQSSRLVVAELNRQSRSGPAVPGRGAGGRGGRVARPPCQSIERPGCAGPRSAGGLGGASRAPHVTRSRASG